MLDTGTLAAVELLRLGAAQPEPELEPEPEPEPEPYPAQALGQAAAAGQGGGAEAEAEQACLAALRSAQSLSRELLRISDGWLRAMDGAPTAAA